MRDILFFNLGMLFTLALMLFHYFILGVPQ